MTAFCQTLTRMGLSASALIALAALLRLLAGNRLPRRMFVALWDIACLRLLVPFFFGWRFSPAALIGARTLTRRAVFTAAGTQTVVPVRQQTIALGEAMSSKSAFAPDVVKGALFALWAIVALEMAAVLIVRYVRSVQRFACSLPFDDPRAARFLQKHPTRRRLQVRVSDAVSSPLSYGLFRPVILLPKGMNRESDETLRFVLLHEWHHIRAMDAARKLLLLLALCVHWMNPMVYVMFLFASRDMELLCDERVLGESGPDARRAYALTLLDLEQTRSLCAPMLSSFSMTAIEERIRTMKNMKKKGAFSLLAAILLVCIACVALATDMPAQELPVSAAQPQSASSSAVTVQPGTAGSSAASSSDAAQDAPRLEMVAGTAAELEASTTYMVQEGIPFLSEESWVQTYSFYAPYGLGYDEKIGRLTFGGKVVRCFEDTVPLDENTSIGTVCLFPDGEVDVIAERDLSVPKDGSAKYPNLYPLLGLRAATQEEFDAYTKSMNAYSEPLADAEVVEEAEDTATYTVTVRGEDGEEQTITLTYVGKAETLTTQELAQTAVKAARENVAQVTLSDESAILLFGEALEPQAEMVSEDITVTVISADGAQQWTIEDGQAAYVIEGKK